MLSLIFLITCALSWQECLATAQNSTYFNPVLSGWHSDPSCIQVDGTFYCVTSTFIAFPGLPIYASRDLINWRLISHAWNRESQLPGASNQTHGQQEGFYAATIRHHDGEFWVICEYLGLPGGMLATIFKSSDPYTETSWADPITFITPAGDLDLFWDDDGKLYIPAGGAVLLDVDLATGEILDSTALWSGTGGVWPEGPHLYRKDGYYYISSAEGGTELGHYQVMARSTSLTGPYEPCPYNPVLTNKGTDEYFQTVGHADLFQDLSGNWWGVALSTRSGPEWSIYPMGRETVLFPVTWDEGEWPVMEPVRGEMSGWPLPQTDRNLPGDGLFNADRDMYDFPAGSRFPLNLLYWRAPPEGAFSIAPEGGLRISPSRANLTGDGDELDGRLGISFVGRVQTDSLFKFQVLLDAHPPYVDHEAGVTLFLTQNNHADLGIVSRAADSCKNSTERVLRFRAVGDTAPPENIVTVPETWGAGPILLTIEAVNATHFTFLASSDSQTEEPIEVGTVSGRLVSGQSGPFTGTILGVYATCNGSGDGSRCPPDGDVYVKRWTYAGHGQLYTSSEVRPSSNYTSFGG
ncbi:unnamed protein product [Clonostachys rosea]|uniref:Beta-xylosidase C-terminal Concanavalin A-like domain-containing protein n=1 Tax=Bionectria ochroleuca TaxID=29856 RepID=A0ABY6UK14_BIOOC|nr:unnamed protein product [Clonostachys rosea]